MLEMSFQVVNPASISIIAKQRGNYLESYITRNDDKIELLEVINKNKNKKKIKNNKLLIKIRWEQDLHNQCFLLLQLLMHN